MVNGEALYVAPIEVSGFLKHVKRRQFQVRNDVRYES